MRYGTFYFLKNFKEPLKYLVTIAFSRMIALLSQEELVQAQGWLKYFIVTEFLPCILKITALYP